MRKFLLGLALLAPFPVSAQTLYRGQSGFDVGPIINCIGLDGSGTARCLVPSVTLVDASGNPVAGSGTPTGTAGAPNAAVVTVQGITGGAPEQVQGNVASGATDSGNPEKIGGRTSTSGFLLPATANGARTDAGYTAYGQALTTIAATTTGSDGFSNGSLAQVWNEGGGLRMLQSASSVFNGTGWDRQRGDTTGSFTVPQPVATASAGIAPTGSDGAASAVLKASAGNLYSLNVVDSTVGGFVVVINATAVPTSGAATPVGTGTGSRAYCMPVAASQGLRDTFNPPLVLSTGIVVAVSTSCTTYTPVATAPITVTGQAK